MRLSLCHRRLRLSWRLSSRLMRTPKNLDKAAACVCLRLVSPLPFGVDGRRFSPAVCAKPGGKGGDARPGGEVLPKFCPCFAGGAAPLRRARGRAQEDQDLCVLPACVTASQAKVKQGQGKLFVSAIWKATTGFWPRGPKCCLTQIPSGRENT